MNTSSIKKSSIQKKVGSAFNPVKKAVHPSQKKLKSKLNLSENDEPYESNEQKIEVNNKQHMTPKKSNQKSLKQISTKTKRISKKQKSTTCLKQDHLIINRDNLPLYDVNSPIKIEQFSVDYHPVTPNNNRKSRKIQQTKIFYSQQFNQVSEIDFEILFRLNNAKKMYSTLLLTQFGEIIFIDRLGSELFEGSLNNLQRNPIQSIILQCRLPYFLQKSQKVTKDYSQFMKLIIYSKNSKRRYSKISNNNLLSHEDIYNRYLKTISARITSIEITFSQYQKFQGYWNKSLVKNNIPLRCYLMRARLSKSLVNLSGLDFTNDRKIMKFMDYTKKKLEKVSQSAFSIKLEQFSNEQDQQQEDIYQTPKREQALCSFEDFKQCQIDIELQDMVKYEKSSTTRGGLLGSSSGKQYSKLN